MPSCDRWPSWTQAYEYPRVHRTLANLYFDVGKPDSAQIVMEVGHGKFPQYKYFHRMLGCLYSKTGRETKAIDEYYHIINQDSGGTVLDHRRLGELLVGQGTKKLS